MEVKSYYKSIAELKENNTSPIPISVLEELNIDKIEGISWQTEGKALVNITIIYEKEDEIETRFISDLIIDSLGSNHTVCVSFTSVTAYDEVYGLYTYRGGVYCLKEGMDIPFEELKLKEQIKIRDLFISKDWELDRTLQ